MKYTCMFARLFRKFEQCMASFVEHFANFAMKLEMFIMLFDTFLVGRTSLYLIRLLLFCQLYVSGYQMTTPISCNNGKNPVEVVYLLF